MKIGLIGVGRLGYHARDRLVAERARPPPERTGPGGLVANSRGPETLGNLAAATGESR
jgi:hypothetical protein